MIFIVKFKRILQMDNCIICNEYIKSFEKFELKCCEKTVHNFCYWNGTKTGNYNCPCCNGDVDLSKSNNEKLFKILNSIENTTIIENIKIENIQTKKRVLLINEFIEIYTRIPSEKHNKEIQKLFHAQLNCIANNQYKFVSYINDQLDKFNEY